MLEILPFPRQDVIAFRIDGTVTAEEVEALERAIEARLAHTDKLQAYVEFVAFAGMPFETFLKDIRLGLRHWRDFSRAAVVTDSKWIERLAALEDRILPHLEVVTFTMQEREQARAWLVANG
jgi:hypothetical protein